MRLHFRKPFKGTGILAAFDAVEGGRLLRVVEK